MSLTRHIRAKSNIYHQIFSNLDLSNCEKLINTTYPLVNKPVDGVDYALCGMSVIYAVREFLCGKERLSETIANYLDCGGLQFDNVVVNAVYYAMRDSIARRGGFVTENAKTLLLKPDVKPTLLDVSNIVANFNTLLRVYKNKRTVVNPTFSASSFVGGADANFIIEDTLFQVLTTAKSVPLTLEKIIQPIGYCMLDTVNEYGLKNIAWYLSRQNVVIKTPINKLVWETDKKLCTSYTQNALKKISSNYMLKNTSQKLMK
jgi:hypothetical protein